MPLRFHRDPRLFSPRKDAGNDNSRGTIVTGDWLRDSDVLGCVLLPRGNKKVYDRCEESYNVTRLSLRTEELARVFSILQYIQLTAYCVIIYAGKVDYSVLSCCVRR